MPPTNAAVSSVAIAYLLASAAVTALWAWAWACWWLFRRLWRWLQIRREVRQCELILDLMHRYDIDVDEALEYGRRLTELEGSIGARRLRRCR